MRCRQHTAADVHSQVFVAARRHLGEILSAFEFLDREALAMTLDQLPNVTDPLPATDVSAAAPPSEGLNWGLSLAMRLWQLLLAP